MKRALQYLNHFEPARLRAAWVALLALAVSLGAGQYIEKWDPLVQGGISVLVVLVPLIQGELTRAKVYAPASVEAGHADDAPTVDGSEVGDDSLEQVSHG